LAKKLSISKSDGQQLSIIGLTSLANDYRLLYFAGKALNFSFTRLEDLPLFGKKDKLGDFSFYHYFQEDTRLNYFLFANKNNEQIAITSFRNFDYFLIISGELNLKFESKLIKLLRTIPVVQAVIPIPSSGVKDIEYLLEDIEMHLVALKLTKKHKQGQWVVNTSSL